MKLQAKSLKIKCVFRLIERIFSSLAEDPGFPNEYMRELSG